MKEIVEIIVKIYLLSIPVTFLSYESFAFKNNFIAIRKAKKILKYKNELSDESKDLKKDLRKKLLADLGSTSFIHLAISASFLLNVPLIFYLKNKQQPFIEEIYREARTYYKKINEVEEKHRKDNAEMYKFFSGEENVPEELNDNEYINMIKNKTGIENAELYGKVEKNQSLSLDESHLSDKEKKSTSSKKIKQRKLKRAILTREEKKKEEKANRKENAEMYKFFSGEENVPEELSDKEYIEKVSKKLGLKVSK